VKWLSDFTGQAGGEIIKNHHGDTESTEKPQFFTKAEISVCFTKHGESILNSLHLNLVIARTQHRR
jgi:hypothetical protein